MLAIFLVMVTTFSFTNNESFTINEKAQASKTEQFLYFSRYLGAAITSAKYERTGYVGYRAVQNAIRNAPVADNDVLNKASSIADPSSTYLYTMLSVDVGFIDYCRLAFSLFGTHIDSLLYLYISIFCLSLILFFFEFRSIKLANIILMLFVVAHYADITTIP